MLLALPFTDSLLDELSASCIKLADECASEVSESTTDFDSDTNGAFSPGRWSSWSENENRNAPRADVFISYCLPVSICRTKYDTEKMSDVMETYPVVAEMDARKSPGWSCSQWTTLVLQRLPKDWERGAVAEMLDSHGFQNTYDFLYLPTSFKTHKCFGYAIINFSDSAHAMRALMSFNGMEFGNGTLLVEWSDSTQGLQALVEKYRNSAIMLKDVADVNRPLLFKDGCPVPFPCPNVALTSLPHKLKKVTSALIAKTTIVIRQLSKHVDRNVVKSTLDACGFDGVYDFLYVPMNFAKAVCFGFATINFTSHAHADAALAHFGAGGNILGASVVAEWSDSNHGLTSLLSKYSNNKVMQDSVPEIYKPIYLCNGQPRPFPNQ